MPLVALNYLLFCHQDIEPEDVISALAPVYGCPDDDPDVSWLECQQSVLREIDGSDNKKKTNEGVLVDLLKDASSTFLMDFIWFSTGYKYMPRSNFKIVVEFNYEEMQHDSLPVAHTCEMLLKFPGQAYDSNREVLEQKLKLSFESVRRSRFDMN
jgi:HECT-domain (ubiquitin-transferase)